MNLKAYLATSRATMTMMVASMIPTIAQSRLLVVAAFQSTLADMLGVGG